MEVATEAGEYASHAAHSALQMFGLEEAPPSSAAPDSSSFPQAITSTGSAECIAVASLFAYDIYRKYIKPDCTGAELLKVSRLVVVGYGIVCGLFGYFLYGVGVGLGWVYNFMGTAAPTAIQSDSPTCIPPSRPLTRRSPGYAARTRAQAP